MQARRCNSGQTLPHATESRQVRGISNINVTLYDIFGYLMPGLVALGSLALFAWSLFIPTHPLHEPALSGEEWFAMFVLAYFLGHLVQALGDLAFSWVRDENFALTAGRRALGPKRMAELEKLTKMTGEQRNSLFTYCDTYLAQQGKTADREIYQYREGFYRGLTIAVVPALVAILITLARGDAQITNGGDVHTLGAGPLVFALVLVLATIGLSFWRYRRFAEYRVRDALFGFLIDSAAEKKSDAAK